VCEDTAPKSDIIISLKNKLLSSSWLIISWKIAELALNNNYSLSPNSEKSGNI